MQSITTQFFFQNLCSPQPSITGNCLQCYVMQDLYDVTQDLMYHMEYGDRPQ